MKRFFLAPVLALLAALAAGCASEYFLGTTLPEELRTVYLPAIRNQSGEPSAALRVRQALEKEIRRDGTLRLVNDERDAATRLDVTVTGYNQEAVSYVSTDTQRPSEYRMALTARVVFVKLPRAQAGEKAETVLWSKDSVRGTETFMGGANAVSAKLECLPEAAKDLAETIVDGCVSPW